jgi:hypothetical protein
MNTTNNGQLTIKCPSCGHQFDPSEGINHHVKEAFRLEGLEQGKLLERQTWENQKTTQELENVTLKGEIRNLTTSRQIAVANAVLEARTEEQQKSGVEIGRLRLQLSTQETAMEELKRKMSQGSQQLQGAALQLTVGDKLRQEFPLDEIKDISTGARGADHLLIVKTAIGRECQSIYIEDKDVQDWQSKFPVKLKEDMLKVGAVHGIIVSTKMPKHLPNGGFYGDRIWVVSPSQFITVVKALRDGIEAVAIEVARHDVSKDTTQRLFDYVTSEAFRQRVVAFLGFFTNLEREEKREEDYLEQRRKARRETYQLMKLHFNTAMGGLQAYTSSSPLIEN